MKRISAEPPKPEDIDELLKGEPELGLPKGEPASEELLPLEEIERLITLPAGLTEEEKLLEEKKLQYSAVVEQLRTVPPEDEGRRRKLREDAEALYREIRELTEKMRAQRREKRRQEKEKSEKELQALFSQMTAASELPPEELLKRYNALLTLRMPSTEGGVAASVDELRRALEYIREQAAEQGRPIGDIFLLPISEFRELVYNAIRALRGAGAVEEPPKVKLAPTEEEERRRKQREVYPFIKPVKTPEVLTTEKETTDKIEEILKIATGDREWNAKLQAQDEVYQSIMLEALEKGAQAVEAELAKRRAGWEGPLQTLYYTIYRENQEIMDRDATYRWLLYQAVEKANNAWNAAAEEYERRHNKPGPKFTEIPPPKQRDLVRALYKDLVKKYRSRLRKKQKERKLEDERGYIIDRLEAKLLSTEEHLKSLNKLGFTSEQLEEEKASLQAQITQLRQAIDAVKEAPLRDIEEHRKKSEREELEADIEYLRDTYADAEEAIYNFLVNTGLNPRVLDYVLESARREGFLSTEEIFDADEAFRQELQEYPNLLDAYGRGELPTRPKKPTLEDWKDAWLRREEEIMNTALAVRSWYDELVRGLRNPFTGRPVDIVHLWKTVHGERE